MIGVTSLLSSQSKLVNAFFRLLFTSSIGRCLELFYDILDVEGNLWSGDTPSSVCHGLLRRLLLYDWGESIDVIELRHAIVNKEDVLQVGELLLNGVDKRCL